MGRPCLPLVIMGKKSISIKDVALKAGVSVSTVSHVMNGTRFVKPETSDRVKAAMDSLEYHPSFLARALKINRTMTIGMLVTNSTNPFFAEVVHGLEDTCFQHGYSLILCNAGGDGARQRAYLKTLVRKQIDALVVMTTNTDSAFYRELRAINDLPMVVLDSGADIEACVVGDDSVYGGSLAAEFLINRGFGHIGFLTGPQGHPRSRDRLKGALKALSEAGIAADSILKVPGELTISGGYKAMRELLEKGRPEALFAFNDLMAMGAYRVAAEAGLEIPRDLSIIGYDDLEIASYMTPALTTIRQPSFGLGSKAAEILIEHLEKKTQLPTTLSLEPKLVVRDSVAGREEE